MTKYLDLTRVTGCVGVIPENGETLVLTGVSVNSMPLSVKRREWELYADFARKYDIHFIFDDCKPEPDFYTVPWIDIAAIDSSGGFLASVGEPFSLRESVRLVYISKERECFLITGDSRKLISMASSWKSALIPCDDIQIYDSEDSARKDYPIIDFEKTKEYEKLMNMKRK